MGGICDVCEDAYEKGFRSGRKGALSQSAEIAQSLSTNHCHHHGVNGLLARCQELADLFATMIEKPEHP